MTIPAGKTPISYLQEYCTERHLTPEYELLSNEGAVHEPTFVMRVKVADTTADGKSTSKKKAKHSAARAALAILFGMQNGMLENEGSGETTPKEEKGVGNPVGELQEFTQKKVIRPPIYSFENDQRPPHERTFFCTVKLGKMVEKGEGRSKRTAKRAAAAAMLAHIHKITASGGDADTLLNMKTESHKEIWQGEPLSIKEPYTEFQKKRPSLLAPQQSRELQLFYEKVMQSAGKQLKSASAPAIAAHYCQMLQDIADTQRFEVALFEVQERTTLGHIQTILKLTTSPVTVCHGCGTTTEDSRASAAHNALQYLRILTKQ
ncbi:RISC-loading complex subunit tarbp2-like [Babylonia areolata]|uniref:RISC-loading complex subunit tarbp2-like n=1 Tax=Babylonia areolata TaxID=304850 RepID=UPI003FD17C3E